MDCGSFGQFQCICGPVAANYLEVFNSVIWRFSLCSNPYWGSIRNNSGYSHACDHSSHLLPRVDLMRFLVSSRGLSFWSWTLHCGCYICYLLSATVSDNALRFIIVMLLRPNLFTHLYLFYYSYYWWCPSSSSFLIFIRGWTDPLIRSVLFINPFPFGYGWSQSMGTVILSLIWVYRLLLFLHFRGLFDSGIATSPLSPPGHYSLTFAQGFFPVLFHFLGEGSPNGEKSSMREVGTEAFLQ